MEVVRLISFLICFCVVCGCSYWGLQKLNFKNLFVSDSTTQIRLIILFISIALGSACAMGFSNLVELVSEIILK